MKKVITEVDTLVLMRKVDQNAFIEGNCKNSRNKKTCTHQEAKVK